MALPTRPLGTTDMAITAVGFGAWAIGGGDYAFGWGDQDDADSVAAIRRAVELGINWIDTAAVYGLGRSEEVVARALAEVPEADRPYVFTKCGFVWDDSGATPTRVGRPDSIRAELDASRRRLGVERIDLYQMHWPPADGTPLEDYWGTLVELRDAGHVRAIGLSNHDPDQLEAAEAIGHVDSLQPPFSAIRRSAAPAIAWCHDHGTGVIVYSPMQSGLLTGSFSPERSAALPANDFRSRNPEFHGDKLARNLELAAAMTRVAERHGTTTAAVAVAWTLTWPGVTGAIVGARAPQQIDGWIGAADLVLLGEDLEEISSAIARTGAGDGPLVPG